MATTRQKQAARRNVGAAQSAPRPARGSSSQGMSSGQRTRLSDQSFAFPDKRKEPLSDAAHVRNAVARFDQVEGVSDAERDAAWKRIRAAARRHGVAIHVRGWRQLMGGGRTAG